MKKKLLFILGTRPEAIKLAPVIIAFRKTNMFDVRVCSTGQHKEMLYQVLDFFEIVPDIELGLMEPNQKLATFSGRCLIALDEVMEKEKPSMIFVQGDTASVLMGALAGYYHKVPVGHVEAGLRSGNKFSPFPEEVFRTLTGHVCDFHFIPTEQAGKNLEKEGITENIFLTGNTVIDALFLALEKIKSKGEVALSENLKKINQAKRIILVTCHRRESFGEQLENIFKAIRALADSYPDVQFVYPVHLNPNVREKVDALLSSHPGILLLPPVSYPELVWLMEKSYLVLTDSGGIQEEAPSLGKPVLVLREVTERMEGVDAGTALLVGTDYETIVEETTKLLENEIHYAEMANAVNPYGDGKASEKIVEVIMNGEVGKSF